jgi:hypothetical protein
VKSLNIDIRSEIGKWKSGNGEIPEIENILAKKSGNMKIEEFGKLEILKLS